jgi:hypothetical protein
MVNLIQLDSFFALNCSKLILMDEIEIMKIIYFFLPISIIALANARKFGLLILKLLM